MKFLVWSIRKNAWWKQNAEGYTKQRDEAARVDLDLAVEWAMTGWKASERAIPEDAIVPDQLADLEGKTKPGRASQTRAGLKDPAR